MPASPLSAARQMAQDRLAAGDYSAADSLFSAILSRYPRDFRTHSLLGRLRLEQGNREGALMHLRLAAAAEPRDREARRLLAECGSEADGNILADLPPLQPEGDERAVVSPAALGHLFLQQRLWAHAVRQVQPLWQTQPERIDLGATLAEGLWRLGLNDEAAEVCASLLRAEADCLAANIIRAQILTAADRTEEAQPLVAAAEALDPENLLGSELCQWLAVRDASLCPFTPRTAEVELDGDGNGERPAAEPAAQESGDRLRLERPPEPEGLPETRVAELALGTAREDEGAPAAEVETESWPLEAWQPAAAPEDSPLQHAPIEAEAANPEPEKMAEGAGRLRLSADSEGVLATLDIDSSGQVRRSTVEDSRAAAWAEAIKGWLAGCQAVGGRLELGSLHYGIIESAAGAVHVHHQGGSTSAALTAPKGNLGMVRVRLRRQRESQEQQQEQHSNWNEP